MNLTEIQNGIETILGQPQGIEREHELGTLLTSARELHPSDELYGKWCATNFSTLKRHTRNNYMKLSRFKSIKQAKLIGKSKCYKLSDEMVATVNASDSLVKKDLVELTGTAKPKSSRDTGSDKVRAQLYAIHMFAQQVKRVKELEAELAKAATDTSEPIEQLESSPTISNDPLDELESLFGMSVSESASITPQLPKDNGSNQFKSRLGLDELEY